MSRNAQASQKSAIFGLQYIEEEDATLLDVVGCQGVSMEQPGPSQVVTIRLCGDGFDRSEDEIETEG